MSNFGFPTFPFQPFSAVKERKCRKVVKGTPCKKSKKNTHTFSLGVIVSRTERGVNLYPRFVLWTPGKSLKCQPLDAPIPNQLPI